jgi:AbiA family abortive infection protein
MHLTQFTFGDFLTYDLWCEAKKLLDFQIEQKATNKHYNKLGFYYFEAAKPCFEAIGEEEYFEERIKTNLFYALQNEFYTLPYAIPKKSLGIRNYYFFSYPMMALYYAVCLYLVKLTSDIVSNRKQGNIISFYGGNLHYKNGNLIINKNTTYYKSYHDEFKRHLNHYAKSERNRYVIKLDIQNYYESLCVTTLLQKIKNDVRYTTRRDMHFEEHTCDQLDFFLHFIKHNNVGIPQSDSNLASSFLGFLYLFFGDNIIERCIESIAPSGHIRSFKIIRYVDDIFIILDFAPTLTSHQKEAIVYHLLNAITHALHEELKLSVNSKTKVFRPHDEVSLLEFVHAIGDVSGEIGEDEDQEEPIELPSSPAKHANPPVAIESVTDAPIPTALEKTDRLFNFLAHLKNQHLNYRPEDLYGGISYDDLKNIFDSRVRSLLDKKENKEKLSFLLNDFNYELCRMQPHALICILLLNSQSATGLLTYLKNLKPNTVYDINLLLTYLCQVDFKEKSLKKILKSNPNMRSIFEKIKECKSTAKPCTGYYKLPYDRIKWIKNQPALVEQIKLRIHNERADSYSVSLNLLLNELQLICYLQENTATELKNYDHTRVDKFLEGRGVRTETKTKVANLFNRRNNNGISHPGSLYHTPTAVSKTEYLDYQQGVHDVLQHILLDN